MSLDRTGALRLPTDSRSFCSALHSENTLSTSESCCCRPIASAARLQARVHKPRAIAPWSSKLLRRANASTGETAVGGYCKTNSVALDVSFCVATPHWARPAKSTVNKVSSVPGTLLRIAIGLRSCMIFILDSASINGPDSGRHRQPTAASMAVGCRSRAYTWGVIQVWRYVAHPARPRPAPSSSRCPARAHFAME